MSSMQGSAATSERSVLAAFAASAVFFFAQAGAFYLGLATLLGSSCTPTPHSPSTAEIQLFAITSTESATVRAAALTTNSDVVIGGDFSGTLAIGETRLQSTQSDGFAARLRSSGTLVWHRQLGGNGNDHIRAIKIAADESVVIAGELQGDGQLPSAMVSILEPNGEVRWTLTLASTRYASATSIALLGSGDLVVAGYFAGSLGRDEVTRITSAGGQDLFVARFRTTGELVWLVRAGGPGTDIGRALVAVGKDTVAVTGHSMAGADFGKHSVVTKSQSSVAIIATLAAASGEWLEVAAGRTGEDTSGQAIEVVDGEIVAGTTSIPALVKLSGSKLEQAGKLLDQAEVTALAVAPSGKLVGSRVTAAQSGQGQAAALTSGVLSLETQTTSISSSGQVRVVAIAVNKTVLVCAGQFVGRLSSGTSAIESAEQAAGFVAFLPSPD